MPTIGTCSKCEGPVQVPELWGGTVPPVPTCAHCGATAKDPNGPIIPMEKRSLSGGGIPSPLNGDFDCPKAEAARSCPCGFCRALRTPSAPVGVEAALSLLRAGHWREVHVGRRYMRLEVTYDYAAWERLMEQVEAALAAQPRGSGNGSI